MFETRQILGPRDTAALGHMARMALAGVVRTTVTSIGAATLLVLAGCGQKGPLYLPDGQTSTAAPPATTPHKTQR